MIRRSVVVTSKDKNPASAALLSKAYRLSPKVDNLLLSRSSPFAATKWITPFNDSFLRVVIQYSGESSFVFEKSTIRLGPGELIVMNLQNRYRVQNHADHSFRIVMDIPRNEFCPTIPFNERII